MKNMKKFMICTTAIVVTFIGISILMCFILNRYVKLNTEAIISEDYSTITYNGKLYETDLIDNEKELPEFFDNQINATVKNRFFLWDYFLTDYIFLSKNGKYIYLITDYDLNKSDYYQLKE